MTARYALPLMLLLGLLLWVALPARAQASDRFWVGLNFGGARPCAQRVWVPGTYVTRTEQVLVQPAHYVDRWVPPVYETRYDRHRRPYTVCVREGYHEKLLVPARYEVREVRELVPGYWREVPVLAHRPPVFLSHAVARPDYRPHDRNDGPREHLGFNIRF